jgi:hypothetical protein
MFNGFLINLAFKVHTKENVERISFSSASVRHNLLKRRLFILKIGTLPKSTPRYFSKSVNLVEIYFGGCLTEE